MSSECHRTADDVLAVRFTKMEWLAPSRAVRMRVTPDAEPARDASRSDLDGLPNQLTTGSRFINQFPVGLEHHLDSLLQVGPGLVQCGALRICSGELLDE